MYFACELFDYQPVLQKIVLVIVHRLKGVSINDRTQLAVRPQVCPLYLFVCYLRTVPWEYQHFHCRLCGKHFKHFHRMRHHNLCHLAKHSRPYKCVLYRKHFIGSGYPSSHYNLRRLSCEKCGRCYQSLSQLRRHKLCHQHDRPHQCETCKRNFRLPRDLRRHKCSVRGKLPFQCNICDVYFIRKSSLRKHSLNHKSLLSPNKIKAESQLTEHTGCNSHECNSQNKELENGFVSQKNNKENEVSVCMKKKNNRVTGKSRKLGNNLEEIKKEAIANLESCKVMLTKRKHFDDEEISEPSEKMVKIEADDLSSADSDSSSQPFCRDIDERNWTSEKRCLMISQLAEIFYKGEKTSDKTLENTQNICDLNTSSSGSNQAISSIKTEDCQLDDSRDSCEKSSDSDFSDRSRKRCSDSVDLSVAKKSNSPLEGEKKFETNARPTRWQGKVRQVYHCLVCLKQFSHPVVYSMHVQSHERTNLGNYFKPQTKSANSQQDLSKNVVADVIERSKKENIKIVSTELDSAQDASRTKSNELDNEINTKSSHLLNSKENLKRSDSLSDNSQQSSQVDNNLVVISSINGKISFDYISPPNSQNLANSSQNKEIYQTVQQSKQDDKTPIIISEKISTSSGEVDKQSNSSGTLEKETNSCVNAAEGEKNRADSRRRNRKSRNKLRFNNIYQCFICHKHFTHPIVYSMHLHSHRI